MCIRDSVLDYEPHVALFVPGADPLLFHRAIAGVAAQCLAPSGMAMVEINSSLAAESVAIFRDEGFAAHVRRDIFGKPRFVVATRA